MKSQYLRAPPPIPPRPAAASSPPCLKRRRSYQPPVRGPIHLGPRTAPAAVLLGAAGEPRLSVERIKKTRTSICVRSQSGSSVWRRTTCSTAKVGWRKRKHCEKDQCYCGGINRVVEQWKKNRDFFFFDAVVLIIFSRLNLTGERNA